MRHKVEAEKAQSDSTDWLADKLRLTVHSRNNVIIKAKQGLYFLGHKIHPKSPLSVDKAMAVKIANNVNALNVSSYKAMHLTARQAKLLPWLMLEHLRKER